MNTIKILLPLLLMLGSMSPAYCRPFFTEEELEEMDANDRKVCEKEFQMMKKDPTVETFFKISHMSDILDDDAEYPADAEERLYHLSEAEKLYDDLIYQCVERFDDITAPDEKQKTAFMKDLAKHIKEAEKLKEKEEQ